MQIKQTILFVVLVMMLMLLLYLLLEELENYIHLFPLLLIAILMFVDLGLIIKTYSSLIDRSKKNKQ